MFLLIQFLYFLPICCSRLLFDESPVLLTAIFTTVSNYFESQDGANLLVELLYMNTMEFGKVALQRDVDNNNTILTVQCCGV